MTAAVSMRKEPLWFATAEETDEITAGMLNITQVAQLTGLAVPTIQTAINAEGANTGRRARLRSLARPKWRWHGIPFWSVEQVSTYHGTVAARWKTREEFAHLPVLEPAEVIRRQLTSLRGAERRTGIPLSTLHRWKNADTFPEAAALMRVNSPTPRVLYPWDELRKCIKEHHADWLADPDHAGVAEALDGITITDTTD